MNSTFSGTGFRTMRSSPDLLEGLLVGKNGDNDDPFRRTFSGRRGGGLVNGSGQAGPAPTWDFPEVRGVVASWAAPSASSSQPKQPLWKGGGGMLILGTGCGGLAGEASPGSVRDEFQPRRWEPFGQQGSPARRRPAKEPLLTDRRAAALGVTVSNWRSSAAAPKADDSEDEPFVMGARLSLPRMGADFVFDSRLGLSQRRQQQQQQKMRATFGGGKPNGGGFGRCGVALSEVRHRPNAAALPAAHVGPPWS